MSIVEIRHFHLFAGLGGGARGFNRGKARVGQLEAKFRCLGGIDVDPGAMRNFHRLAGVPGTVLDMFDREQYVAFHGAEPPAGWNEATPADIRRAAGNERPHIVFLSAPCKGFSGLLSESKSKTAKYQALNRLTLRGVWLMLEAWADDPPELVLFENVPRLATRGRALLDQITAMLRAYGYATAETTHDCGELGGLAQSRKRFLLVARHLEKVPPLLYEPQRRPLRAVGDVLGKMLLPGDLNAGPMHRIPSLQWKTWVRLAFVEAGSDWRSLNRLAVEDGMLRDYLVVPCSQEGSGSYGVRSWEDSSDAIRGRSGPSNGPFSVADVRKELYSNGYGVLSMADTAGAVSGESLPSNGRFAVADMRPPAGAAQYQQYGVLRWRDSSGALIGVKSPGQGRFSVADTRCPQVKHNNCFKVVRYDGTAGSVTGGTGPSAGGQCVADPRSGMAADRSAYLTGGHYGVVPWEESSGAVSAAACHDNGRWSVADHRMPAAADNLITVITAEDGTWHRPFTTLELACLQSLLDPEHHLLVEDMQRWALSQGNEFALDHLTFDSSDQVCREQIGNAVPSDSAEAIADEMGRTLLLAWSGETFQLSSAPVWVQPALAALMVAQGAMA